MVARPAPVAQIVPGERAWLGAGGVVWTEEGTHKGCPYGDSNTRHSLWTREKEEDPRQKRLQSRAIDFFLQMAIDELDADIVTVVEYPMGRVKIGF